MTPASLDAIAARAAAATPDADLPRFWSYDGSDYILHATADEARAACEGALHYCREEAGNDGWPEETDQIMWGPIAAQVTCTEVKTLADWEAEGDESMVERMKANGWDETEDHTMVEMPDPERDALFAALREARATSEMHSQDHDNLRESANAALLKLTAERDTALAFVREYLEAGIILDIRPATLARLNAKARALLAPPVRDEGGKS